MRAAVQVLSAALTVGLLSCALESTSRGEDVPDWTGGNGDSGSIPAAPCVTHAECPSGYTCDLGACVPPESETDRSLAESPPVATPRYVYALNTAASSVARIDPANLQIEAVIVGPEPVALTALPGEDAAVVLSRGDGSLSVIDSNTLPSRVQRIALKRQHQRLAVSPDGAFAVAFPGQDEGPVGGAEGILTIVDLTKLRSGAPDGEVVLERAAGYRITDVIFQIDEGVATKLHVFSKSSIATIDLRDLSQLLPTRVPLPASMSESISAREVVANDTGTTILLRGTVAPELAYFDGTELRTATLPEVATDLDLWPDGTAALAALRTSGQVAFIEIPADLEDPSGIDLFDVPGAAVGQLELAPDLESSGRFALVYTNATSDESFARIELPSGEVTRYTLEKRVEEISFSPDGRSAVIIHRRDPDSAAQDPYERAVDLDEGYSILDLDSGYVQLKRTGAVRPTRYAFSPQGGYLGIALRSDGLRQYAVDAVNLSTLIATSLPLASAPTFMGTVPEVQGITPHRVFVSQAHPAGRISVVQLDDRQVRTATGFTLNSEIE